MRYLLICLLLLATSAQASITEGGRGMLFGGNHAFAVTATKGWVLDNESGVTQGVHMAFYPAGETWADSPVIVYGQVAMVREVGSVRLLVDQTVTDFRQNGSPDYVANKGADLSLSGGKSAEIYFYTGDQWGNSEAAAYIQEKDTINFLVFNARNKEQFDRYLEAFYQTVKSYENLYVSSVTLSEKDAARLMGEAASSISTTVGKGYEAAAVRAVGQKIAEVMRDCTAYLPEEELPAFDYFVYVGRDGAVQEWQVFPPHALSACFSGLMTKVTYPKHRFDRFVLHLHMVTKP